MPDEVPGGYMSAEELTAALIGAGVPVTAASPDAGAEKLREYWVHGPGAAKIRWGSAGDFDRCVMHLRKYVRDPKGLCNTYHTEALGAPPGKGHAAAARSTSATLRDVELARPGTFDLASGKATFTEKMLRDAADFYVATGRGAIPVGLGHMDQRFDGDPAFGWVENVRYLVDDRGPVLLGDVVDMPGWLAAEAPKRWRNRSIEAFSDVEFNGRTYGMALTRLALLGATPPGIPSISSLSDLQTALAASTRLVASIADPEPSPPESPPDVQPPAPTVQEGTGMDPVKLREALGLPADASDQEVTAALSAAGLAPPPTTPEPAQAPPAAPAPAFSDAPPTGPTALPADVPQPLAAAAAAAGAVVLDRGVWEQTQAQIAEGVAAARKLREQERDTLITAAVADGRIPPANRGYWEKLWDGQPKPTAELIASLARNRVPVEATGYAGGDDDDAQDPYAHLFPPQQSKGA